MRNPGHSRVPLGLIGMLGAVLALEITCFRSDRYATDQSLSWNFKGNWASTRSRDADLLIFGDSLLEFGLIPEIVREQTGLRTVNLAAHNGNPALSFFLLRRALKAGARPRVIVVDLMPHQIAKSPENSEFLRSWPGFLSMADSIDLGYSLRDADFWGSTWVAKVIPSVVARNEIRAATLAAFRGKAYSAREQARILQRNWEINSGAQVVPSSVSKTVAHFDGLFPSTWKTDPETIQYVDRFLALAADAKVPVYCLIPPLREGAQRWRDDRDLDRPYLAYLRSLANRHPGVTIIDARRLVLGDSSFADAVHLNRSGAVTLSGQLAHLFAEAPKTGRILMPENMPPFQSTPEIEDLAESRVVVMHNKRKDKALRR